MDLLKSKKNKKSETPNRLRAGNQATVDGKFDFILAVSHHRSPGKLATSHQDLLNAVAYRVNDNDFSHTLSNPRVVLGGTCWFATVPVVTSAA